MQQAPIIHVVDDEELFLVAISRLLRAVGYEVRTYSNAGDFLLARSDHAPGCVLLDLRMPGPSGLDLQRALAMQIEPLPIIFLSGYGDVSSAVRAIKAGAVDFLTKPVKREVLLKAIEQALVRDSEIRILRAQLSRWRKCYETLTECEAKIFAEVVAGRMNKEIAVELGMAERTVKAHRAKVMEKMRAASVAELVHVADQLQLHRVTDSHPGPSPNGRSPAIAMTGRSKEPMATSTGTQGSGKKAGTVLPSIQLF